MLARNGFWFYWTQWRNDDVTQLAMILWRAWSVRNKVTRAGEVLSIEDSVQFLQLFMAQYQEAHDPKTSERAVHSGGSCIAMPTLWNTPAKDAIKINVYGAYNTRNGRAAVGVIARDHEGHPHIMAWRMLFHFRDAEEAETLAMLEGLKFAGRWP
jgi:hypothetical protein